MYLDEFIRRTNQPVIYPTKLIQKIAHRLKYSVVLGCMEATMRKLICIILLTAMVSTQVGCFVPMWSSSPDRRARQLIFQSESFRHIPNIWERFWGLDMPDVATPYRTHGGVI